MNPEALAYLFELVRKHFRDDGFSASELLDAITFELKALGQTYGPVSQGKNDDPNT